MNKHRPEEISVISQLDTVVALADAQPRCTVGHEPLSRTHGHWPCEQSAVWAFRTHDGMGEHPTGACPAVVLICDAHLEQLRDNAEHNLAHARRSGRCIACFHCGVRTDALEELMWGIERIRS